MGSPEETRERIQIFGGPGPILWVCANREEATRRFHDLGKPKNVRMACPGQTFAGVGFDEIFVEDPTRIIDTYSHAAEWLDMLKCRLHASGQMHYIYIEYRT